MKKEIMELNIEVKLSNSAVIKMNHGSHSLGPFKLVKKWTPEKIYTTVGLSKKYFEDGSNVSIYYIFDDTGELRETVIENWIKIKRKGLEK